MSEDDDGNPIACATCRQWPCKCTAGQAAYVAALRIDNAGDSPASYDLKALEVDAYIVAAEYLSIMDRRPPDVAEVLRLSETALILVLANRPESENAPTNIGLRAALDKVRAALAKPAEEWHVGMESAPRDETIWVWCPEREGLSSMISLCQWHDDAGFCVDELRTPTHWRLLQKPSPPLARHAAKP